MKTELSSLEIRVLADELKSIVGGRIQKVFQEGKMIHVLMHVPRAGTRTLVIGDGKIFLTKYRLRHSAVPTNFAMYLRKYCVGKRIRNVYQHDFERIVIIEMDEYRLIAELFSKGNVIFADMDNSIWSVLERQTWSTRKIKQKEEYHFPPQGIDPTALATDVFMKALVNSSKQLVAFLARELSLGGTFAEEICLEAKVDKKKECSAVTEKEAKSLLEAIGALFERERKPQIVFEEGAESDVLPFDVEKYAGHEKKYYDSFVDAIDDFFVRKMAETDVAVQKKEAGAKKDKLSKRIEGQKDAVEKLKKLDEASQMRAELIYEHYQSFEKILDAANKMGLEGAGKAVKQISSVDMKSKTLTVDVNGTKVDIDTRVSLNENANRYYEMAKKAREKHKRAEEALGETLKLMRGASEAPVKKVILEEKSEASKWYHKFRWFVSSGGFVVVGGKDATSNEVLVKKHVDDEDVVFHTDITGSPFVVVKTEGKEADKRTLDEAAQFAGIYSRAWKAGVGASEVYHVSPKQVSKKAPSGQYINKGSFMIYGKKNVMRAELRLGVGLRDGEIITGPEMMVMNATKKYVAVEPGDMKSSELAKKIKAELFRMCSKEEQEIIRRLSTDVIARAIPFGEGRIV